LRTEHDAGFLVAIASSNGFAALVVELDASTRR